jgi:hypothetical protein
LLQTPDGSTALSNFNKHNLHLKCSKSSRPDACFASMPCAAYDMSFAWYGVLKNLAASAGGTSESNRKHCALSQV